MSTPSKSDSHAEAARARRPPPLGRPHPTPLEWVLLVGGLVLVNHYAWLLDDAFIFFRYVDNLVLLDYGLVYNRGEYVEGFSSPAWALLLATLRSTGLDFWWIVRGLGALGFTLFWWGLIVSNRAQGPGEDRAPTLNFPLVYLGLQYAVLCYFTSGVETPLVQIVAIAFALFFIDPDRWLPAIGVGAATLVRPELALASALAVLWCWIATRRFPWRPTAVGAIAVGGWLLFRIVYYAELLPNTFYLKHLPDWGQGFVYLHETLYVYGVYWVGPIFAALAFALWRRGVDFGARPRLGMLLVSAAIALYFVRVGGDPRHYRYLAFSFCLGTAALGGLAEHALAHFAPQRALLPGTRRAVLAAGLVVALIVSSHYPPQLSAHPIRLRVGHTITRGINDAAYHRNHERLAISPWSFERVTPSRPVAMTTDDYPGTTSASWCEWAYRIPGIRVIHNLGLTDPILARVKMRPDRPGHKSGLQPMAREIEALHRHYTPGLGMYSLAVEQGRASDWMERNLEVIEVIERKIYNRHDPLENLRLAFTFPGRIQP